MMAIFDEALRFMLAPEVAIKLILIVEGMFLYFVYSLWKGYQACMKPPQDKDMFWKPATMIAEILVMGGLLGLATFAAKERSLFNMAELERVSLDAHTDLSKKLNEARDSFCRSSPRSLRPEPANAVNYEFCQTIRTAEVAVDHQVQWQEMKKRLVDFSAGISQVSPFSRSYSATSSELIASLDSALKAMVRLAAEKGKPDRVVSHSSWILVFIAFIMAGIGVAIKVAKAISEAAPEIAKLKAMKWLLHFVGWIVVGFLLSVIWLSVRNYSSLLSVLIFCIAVFGTQWWRKHYFKYSATVRDYFQVGLAYLIATLIALYLW